MNVILYLYFVELLIEQTLS